MGNSDDVDLVGEGEVERRAGSVAESEGPNLGNALGLERSNNVADYGELALGRVFREPVHEVEGATGVESIRVNTVITKEIRGVNFEAIASIVVGQQLILERKPTC